MRLVEEEHYVPRLEVVRRVHEEDGDVERVVAERELWRLRLNLQPQLLIANTPMSVRHTSISTRAVLQSISPRTLSENVSSLSSMALAEALAAALLLLVTIALLDAYDSVMSIGWRVWALRGTVGARVLLEVDARALQHEVTAVAQMVIARSREAINQERHTETVVRGRTATQRTILVGCFSRECGARSLRLCGFCAFSLLAEKNRAGRSERGQPVVWRVARESRLMGSLYARAREKEKCGTNEVL